MSLSASIASRWQAGMVVSTSANRPLLRDMSISERSGPAAERERAAACPASGSLVEGRSRSGAARSRRAVRPI